MSDAKRRSLIVAWCVLLALVPLAVTVALIADTAVDLMSQWVEARILLGVAVTVIGTAAAVRFAWFFVYPPKIRFIRGVTSFVVWFTATAGGGMWVAIPVSRLYFKDSEHSFELTTTDATWTTAILGVAAFIAVCYLVRVYPDEATSP